MKSWTRLPYLVAGFAALFIAVSSIVAAIRQGSWGPVMSVAWLPAVIVATWSGGRRRCVPGRRGPAR